MWQTASLGVNQILFNDSEALPGVLRNRNKGIYFRGTREQRSKNEGNRRTKAISENLEQRKSRFEEGNKKIYFGLQTCRPWFSQNIKIE